EPARTNAITTTRSDLRTRSRSKPRTRAAEGGPPTPRFLRGHAAIRRASAPRLREASPRATFARLTTRPTTFLFRATVQVVYTMFCAKCGSLMFPNEGKLVCAYAGCGFIKGVSAKETGNARMAVKVNCDR